MAFSGLFASLRIIAGALAWLLFAAMSPAFAQAHLPYGMRFGEGEEIAPATAATYYNAIS